MAGSCYAGKEEQGGEHDNPRYDGSVGQVKHRPNPKVYEIGYLPHADPVEEIAHGAAQLHAHTQPEQTAGERGIAVYDQKEGDTHERSEYKEHGLVREEPKGAPRVEGVGYADRSMPGDGLPYEKGMPYDGLGDLVQAKDKGYGDEQKRVFVPGHPAG